MFFKGSQKIIYDNAYQAYREILDFIKSFFFDESGHPKDISEDLPNYVSARISTDIYIQTRLFNIAISDNKISESEKYFIISLIDNIDTLKKAVPSYRDFLSKMDIDTLDAVAEDGFYDPLDIPIVLLLSIHKDAKEHMAHSYDLINKIELILKSIIELEGLDIKSENVVYSQEIERLNKFTEDNGIIHNQTVELTANKVDDEKTQDTLAELLEELNSLIGLTRVKEDVASTINFLKINKMRRQKGLSEVPVSNHMVFLGNPGTGKTTVARLLAKIYKELGVVSRGQLIETDRAGLVAGYVGQTAIKTTEVVKKAIGGVLFIDEAYSLASGNDSGDFGGEAIDTLVKLMEDNRNDLIVIVAGYNDEMHAFIDSNPGLSSRFNRYFTFDDYSCNELIEIFKNICRKNGFVVSESAIKELRSLITMSSDMSRFGNARGVRNIFDKAILNQADRLMKQKNVSKADLTTIIASDLTGIDVPSPKDKSMGFI